jgi:hypothetical protein
MQRYKRGNGKRKPKRVRRSSRKGQECLTVAQSSTVPRLSLYARDPITGNEDLLSNLFYEYYRGYTIYSTEQGRCCIHGKDGCLRIQGKYAAFPDVEQAKLMIQYFQAEGRTPSESMNRYIPEQEYLCLNGRRPGDAHRRERCHRDSIGIGEKHLSTRVLDR